MIVIVETDARVPIIEFHVNWSFMDVALMPRILAQFFDPTLPAMGFVDKVRKEVKTE
jgi:hypothetical protein